VHLHEQRPGELLGLVFECARREEVDEACVATCIIARTSAVRASLTSSVNLRPIARATRSVRTSSAASSAKLRAAVRTESSSGRRRWFSPRAFGSTLSDFRIESWTNAIFDLSGRFEERFAVPDAKIARANRRSVEGCLSASWVKMLTTRRILVLALFLELTREIFLGHPCELDRAEALGLERLRERLKPGLVSSLLALAVNHPGRISGGGKKTEEALRSRVPISSRRSMSARRRPILRWGTFP